MPSDGPIRFGVFEVDLAARELRKRGVRVKLQDQPFRVLEALLEKPGEIVTREELKERLWAQDEFVEFDKSLNTAVQKIRQVLGDSASSPRFLETVPKVGYRFVAPVQRTGKSKPAPSPKRRLVWLAIAALAVVAAVVLFGPQREDRAPEFRLSRLTSDPGSEYNPSFSPDGLRVAYQVDDDSGRSDIYVKLAEASAPATRITPSPRDDIEPSWSPDGSRLVFARIVERRPAHIGSRFKLVIVRPVENAAEQEIATPPLYSRNPAGIKPRWAPDGRHIVFSCKLDRQVSQTRICVYSFERQEVWPVTSPLNKGIGDNSPVLSPDGRKLAFLSASQPGAAGLYLQELAADMRPVGQPVEVPGAAGGVSAGWSRDGSTLYFMGLLHKGETGLWSYTIDSNAPPKQLRPGGGSSAAFWEGPGGELRIAYRKPVRDAEIVLVDLEDPSKSSVIAPSTAMDFHPQFSPDGSEIAFMSERSGQIGIWICGRDGSNSRLLVEVGPLGVFSMPVWSPDGTRIAVDGFHGYRNVHIVDVATRQVSPALTSDGGRYPTWGRGGQSLYYYSDKGGKRALWRLDLEANRHTKLLERPGIFDIAEGADGETIYFRQGFDLMRAQLLEESVREPELLQQEIERFAVTPDAAYYRTRAGAIVKRDLHSGDESIVLQTGGMLRASTLGIAVSRDGRWLAYTRWLRNESDLEMLTSVP